ncbi:hypothetical protein LOCC1_G008068 [Lachnellula occidentalis]|uniref:Uncharacterized protein n=1 Tax=Lachnellula occidentalis TaxID=215460 RepID=A0A8H8RVS4_9HELO|nr:hypothetical protein LOCC1_G008068 [Lachnellula occidentalis]
MLKWDDPVRVKTRPRISTHEDQIRYMEEDKGFHNDVETFRGLRLSAADDIPLESDLATFYTIIYQGLPDDTMSPYTALA